MFTDVRKQSNHIEEQVTQESSQLLHPHKITYRVEVRLFISLLLSLFIYIIASSISSGWALLMSVSLFTIAVLSLLVPALILNCLRLEISAPDQVSAGEQLPVNARIQAPDSLLPLLRCFVVELHVAPAQRYSKDEPAKKYYLDKIDPQQTLALKSPALKRGIRKLPELSIETSFPFGLVWCRAAFQSEKKLAVLPESCSVEGRFLYRLRSGSYVPGDSQGSNTGFQSCYARGVRAYNRSDSRRHIHWALSARHGRLMVREFEREGIPAFDLALDNGAAWTDSSQYELAITAAASLLELGHSLGIHPELFVLDAPLAAGDSMPGRCLDIDQQLLKLAGLERIEKNKSDKGRRASDPEAFAGRSNALLLVTCATNSAGGEQEESRTRSSVFVIKVAQHDGTAADAAEGELLLKTKEDLQCL